VKARDKVTSLQYNNQGKVAIIKLKIQDQPSDRWGFKSSKIFKNQNVEEVLKRGILQGSNPITMWSKLMEEITSSWEITIQNAKFKMLEKHHIEDVNKLPSLLLL
jgi:hypothetical protein